MHRTIVTFSLASLLASCSGLDGTGACSSEIDRAIGRYGTPDDQTRFESDGVRVDTLEWDAERLSMRFTAGREIVGCEEDRFSY